MRTRSLSGAMLSATLALAAAFPCAAIGQIAQNTSGTQTSSVFNGQSFLAPGTGNFDNIVFSYQSTNGNNVGAGKIYLFSSAYTGTPAGLATASGALGSAAYNVGTATNAFTFNPSLTLTGGSTYYVYGDRSFTIGASSTDPYASGQRYGASTASSAFAASSGVDLRFIVNGTAVSAAPEPDIWVMMIIGFGIVGVTLRRRKRTSSSGSFAALAA